MTPTPTPVSIPDLVTVIGATSDFVSPYLVFVVGGLVIGLATALLNRFVKLGR